MEWEGKLIYKAARRQAVKLHKELQCEGVCHLNVMLLWVCARIYKQLKLNAPLYDSTHIHSDSSTNDSGCILCLLTQI